MKHAVMNKKQDADDLQAEDDTAARMPWPGVYLNGQPAPVGQWVTEHLYSVDKHPSKEKWKYPVADDRDLKGKGQKKDVLDADWFEEAPAKEKK